MQVKGTLARQGPPTARDSVWWDPVDPKLVNMLMQCQQNGDWTAWNEHFYAYLECQQNGDTDRYRPSYDLDILRMLVIAHLFMRSAAHSQGLTDPNELNWNDHFRQLIHKMQCGWECFPDFKHRLQTLAGPNTRSLWTNNLDEGLFPNFPQIYNTHQGTSDALLNEALNITVNLVVQDENAKPSELNNLLRLTLAFYFSAIYLMWDCSWGKIVQWIHKNKMPHIGQGILMMVIGFARECGLPPNCSLLRHPFFQTLLPCLEAEHIIVPNCYKEWIQDNAQGLNNLYHQIWRMVRRPQSRNQMVALSRRRRSPRSPRKRSRLEHESETTSSAALSVTSTTISTLREQMNSLVIDNMGFGELHKDRPHGTILDLMVYTKNHFMFYQQSMPMQSHQDASECVIQMLVYVMNSAEFVLAESRTTNFQLFLITEFLRRTNREQLIELFVKANHELRLSQDTAEILLKFFVHLFHVAAENIDISMPICVTFAIWAQSHWEKLLRMKECPWTSDYVAQDEWDEVSEMVLFMNTRHLCRHLPFIGDDLNALLMINVNTLQQCVHDALEPPAVSIKGPYIHKKSFIAGRIMKMLIDALIRWTKESKVAASLFTENKLVELRRDLTTGRGSLVFLKPMHLTASQRARERKRRKIPAKGRKVQSTNAIAPIPAKVNVMLPSASSSSASSASMQSVSPIAIAPSEQSTDPKPASFSTVCTCLSIDDCRLNVVFGGLICLRSLIP